ncbi:transcription factor bHLH106 [Momordica charantia]|uniref:Transcription factor bHLH106 n=1 Tax=Momordica charantia TaxID=3673 RepID=A0A6J1DU20_MOMCH|nr:transcription factor bHLH106 [Momordica charantia]
MQPDQSSELYRFLAQNGAFNLGSASCGGFPAAQSFSSSSSYYPLESPAAAMEPPPPSPHDRALAALKNHKEAEKRRRERINSHLDKLRALLPCNSKTDKASLLAKVVERVKELKQQTAEMAEVETLPSETDEISVLSGEESDDGRLVFKASLCCEDRSDLIPDLNDILNSLHLKTLRADIVTVGGRIRNVLLIAAAQDHSIESLHFLHNALKSLLERSNSSSDRSKRRRLLHTPPQN